MARVRSPNFPVIGLGKAIERARAIFDKEQQLAATREVISKHLGYSGYNGKSAKVISALGKYGLIEPAKDGRFKLSQRAMRILFPRSDEDKQQALNEAAGGPVLFREISTEWDGGSPSDENLANFLLHRGFSQSAISPAISAYRDTQQLVTQIQGQYGPSEDDFDEDEAEDGTSDVMAKRDIAREVGSEKQREKPPSLSGEPFAVQFIKGGILGSFDLRNKEDVDAFIAGLEALKVFLPTVSVQDGKGS